MIESTVSLARTKPLLQPWLSSTRWDCLFILSPAFLASFVALALRPWLENAPNLPLWAFVCFVLCVDVAHVYATLFRTYLEPEAFRKNRALLLAIPAACWGIGCLLYSLDGQIFWRVLAYLAVFHFIRQQYGFMALYSRKDPPAFQKFKWLDNLAVYTATLYPLLFWHTHLPRNFNWFIEGDFVEAVPLVLARVALGIYVAVSTLYVAKEVVVGKWTGFVNIPKNLILVGTALSWWVGIVALNSDIAFTMTNVLTHGIPYMALIWLYHHKPIGNATGGTSKAMLEAGNATAAAGLGTRLFSVTAASRLALSCVPAFLAFIVLLAYLEEGLWDGFIWREHLSFFVPFAHLPAISDSAVLAVLVPLLALPQSTHYVLDGFIWRVKDRSSIWST
ncbi:MAG TPA: hypothetical protein V6D08_14035 [Candidatus Obscuribacterales bacterium]